MAPAKSFLLIGIGVIIISSVIISSKVLKKFDQSDKPEKPSESILIPMDKVLSDVSSDEFSFNLVNKKDADKALPKAFKGIKTSFAFYHPSSTCSIELDVNSMRNDTQKGVPYTIKIVVTDFSSEKSRIECSKAAMENLLPAVIQGGFASVIKTKIYEEGTIFTILRPGNMPSTALEDSISEGGFVLESLNGALSLTPNRFELYITDCSIIKCGE